MECVSESFKRVIEDVQPVIYSVDIDLACDTCVHPSLMNNEDFCSLHQ